MVNSENKDTVAADLDSAEAEHLRKLFIGGLDHRTTDENLKKFYEQWGTVVDVIVMKDPQTKKSRGFGFITYLKVSMVDEAQVHRPHVIDGKVVESKRAIPRGLLARTQASSVQEANTTVKKIFVAGFRDELTEEDLRKYFGRFGNILNINLVSDRETGRTKGYGFIDFADYDSVDRIILKGDHVLKGRRLDVKKALNKNDGKSQNKKDSENNTQKQKENHGPSGNMSGNNWNQNSCGPGMGPMGYGSNWGPSPWQNGPPMGCMNGPGMNNYMGNPGIYGPGVGMGGGMGMGMGGGYGPGIGNNMGFGMGVGMPGMIGNGPGMAGGMGMGPNVGGMGPGGFGPNAVGPNMHTGMGIGNPNNNMGPNPGMGSGYGMGNNAVGMNNDSPAGRIGGGSGMNNYGIGYGMGNSVGGADCNIPRGGGPNAISEGINSTTWNSNPWRNTSNEFGSSYGQQSGGGPIRGSVGTLRALPYDSGNRSSSGGAYNNDFHRRF